MNQIQYDKPLSHCCKHGSDQSAKQIIKAVSTPNPKKKNYSIIRKFLNLIY